MSERSTPSTTGLVKSPTHIPGFDDIANGGLPAGRTSLVLGGSGTGKTVFALHTLVNAARYADEPGIYLSFEESSAELLTNAASFAWDIATLERDDKLVFVDAQFSPDTTRSGAFTLEGTLSSIEAKVEQIAARWVVFDSLDVLLDLLNDPEAARQEMRRIRNWLRRLRITGIITTRAGTIEHPNLQHPFLLYLADFVLLLSFRVTERIALRELRIIKYRGSAFEQNEFPFTIGAEGIEVGSFGLKAREAPVFDQQISSGVSRLDSMLHGGYYRGSSILVTGAPGTAKTTLAGSFAQAAGRRKERTLYIAFDESPKEIVRNLASVNIRLPPFIETGLLQMHSMQGGARSAEEHLIRIKALIEGYEPRCMVVDPLSALAQGGARLSALAVAQRLMLLAKERGITLLGTSLMDATDPHTEAAKVRVSTIADTWIHLTYIANAGERNRALTIVKARGIGHSNQVRELVLTDEGVMLADVYTTKGQVLMGALRAEREAEERMETERLRSEMDRKRRELQTAEAETLARIRALEYEAETQRGEAERRLDVSRASLQRELEAKRIEIERIEQQERFRQQFVNEQVATLRTLRHVDVDQDGAAPHGGAAE